MLQITFLVECFWLLPDSLSKPLTCSQHEKRKQNAPLQDLQFAWCRASQVRIFNGW